MAIKWDPADAYTSFMVKKAKEDELDIADYDS